MLAVGAVALTALLYAVMRYMAQGSVALSVLFPAAMSVCVLWYQIHVEGYALSLQKRLSLSGILEKIAVGPQELAKIYDYTPWPWSLLILGPRPRHLRGWIRLVARNLDWYLAEPRLLIRFESVSYLLGWRLYFGFVLQRITAPMDGRSALGTVLLIMFYISLFFLWKAKANDMRSTAARPSERAN